MMDTQDAPPLYPLLGFAAGVVDGAVALRFDFAICRTDYLAGEGESQHFAMTPEAAIDIGKALMERGTLALNGPN